MRNRYLKRWFFASSAVCLGILLTGCQTTESMVTRIPPPGTQLAGQEYYSPGSASTVTPSVDYTPNDRNTIQGTDSWSPRARQPMQIATDPEGRQISYEEPVGETNSTADDQEVIRISVGNGATDQTVTVPAFDESVDSSVPDPENDRWMTRQ
ncbi:MAG: hypothetical protein VX738_07080 [Planctomycetota bacterium]|nr:hypothetical protein [Planctomycetota bacterium]